MNFPWFNTPRYWQEQLQHLREQAVLLEEVLERFEKPASQAKHGGGLSIS